MEVERLDLRINDGWSNLAWGLKESVTELESVET